MFSAVAENVVGPFLQDAQRLRGFANRLWRRVSRRDAAAKAAYRKVIEEEFGPDIVEPCLKWNPVLHQVAAPILNAASSDFTEGLYCGLFPTSRPTAHVQPVTGGAVIFISTGMLQAVADYSFVIVRSSHLDDAADSDFKIFEPAEAQKLLDKVRDNARAGDKPLMPPSSGFSGAISARCHPAHSLRLAYEHGMLINFLQFIIAHEVAHVTRRHLWAPAQPQREFKDFAEERTQIFTAAASWADEMEADAEAVRIMMRSGTQHWEDPFVGLLLFSEMTHAIFPTQVNPSHPHPMIRRAAAIRELEAGGMKLDFHVCEVLSKIIFALRNDQSMDIDKAALAQLQAWANDAPDNIYVGHHYKSGRVVDRDEMQRQLGASFEQGRAIVAYFACSALASPSMVTGVHDLRLGLSLENFRAVWGQHPGIDEFESVLSRTMPFLGEIEEMWNTSNLSVSSAPDTSGNGSIAPS